MLSESDVEHDAGEPSYRIPVHISSMFTSIDYSDPPAWFEKHIPRELTKRNQRKIEPQSKEITEF